MLHLHDRHSPGSSIKEPVFSCLEKREVGRSWLCSRSSSVAFRLELDEKIFCLWLNLIWTAVFSRAKILLDRILLLAVLLSLMTLSRIILSTLSLTGSKPLIFSNSDFSSKALCFGFSMGSNI